MELARETLTIEADAIAALNARLDTDDSVAHAVQLLLGCTGRGNVNKFAEIVAGVVLAGELSLGAAISSSDWVSSHEQYGRNR